MRKLLPQTQGMHCPQCMGRIHGMRNRKYKENQKVEEREGSAEVVGLEGSDLVIVRPAVVLLFLRAGESGIGRSAMAELAGVGTGERMVKFFSVASLSRLVGGWHWLGGGGMLCSWCCFGLCIEVCGSDRELITKEIDKAGGGVGGGESGVKPKGESGVLSRLVGMAAGVGAGLVVWSETGDGPSSAGAGGAVAGTEGPASVVSAAGMWIGLVGGVDIATLRGMASAMFIFRIYQSGKGQDAFVIGASCCQFLCKNLTNIHAIARYNGVNEEQPCSIHRLVVRGGHDVSFNKCVPQLCLGPKAEAADRMWVSARCVPSCTLFTQKIFDLLKIFFFERIEHRVEAGVIIWQAQDGVDGGCVGCNSSATNGYVIVSSRVVGVELYYPVEICSGWLPCQAKPAEIIQPVVYDLL
ncbi:hypothetical protein V6N13_048437 [Hibiscus sabdariffa]